jgi:hypothetical protein
MAPAAITFSQKIAEDLAIGGQDLIFVCGHYEGFDERIFNWVDLKNLHWGLCAHRRGVAGSGNHGCCVQIYSRSAWASLPVRWKIRLAPVC